MKEERIQTHTHAQVMFVSSTSQFNNDPELLNIILYHTTQFTVSKKMYLGVMSERERGRVDERESEAGRRIREDVRMLKKIFSFEERKCETKKR